MISEINSDDIAGTENDDLRLLIEEKTRELNEKLIGQKKAENNLRNALERLEKSRTASLNLMDDLHDEIYIREKREEENISLLMRQNALLGAIPDILMEVNTDKIYTWANSAGYAFFGDNVIGKRIDEFFPEKKDTIKTIDSFYNGSENPLYIESWQVRKDGEVRLLAWWWNIMKNSDGITVGSLTSARDITEVKNKELELKKANRQLADLFKNLQRVREEERKLIARELHDELGQSLTAVKIDLDTLLHNLDDAESTRFRINEIISLVGDSIKTVKNLTAELRPHILDDLGLIPAIEWYTSDFYKRTRINIHLRLNKSILLPAEMDIVVFRIMQESLTNIARHSFAKNTIITLFRNNSGIVLEIEDDGIGFSLNESKAEKSFGLLNMKERAKEIGGTLIIESEINNGTLIKLNIALAIPDVSE